jgi:hypothetical protein
MRGHNTAYNAGVFGRHMGCKVVVLNHFGSVSCGKEYVSRMIAEAREGNENASQIVASHDFLEVWIFLEGGSILVTLRLLLTFMRRKQRPG